MSSDDRPSQGAVWLNGAFVERDDARISAFDAAVQHAVGLFETMLARGGHVIDLEAHLRRLTSSARELGLSDDLDESALAESTRAAAERAALDRARVRLTVTGGDLNLLRSTRAGEPTVLIDVQPATDYPAEMFERGVTATVADLRVNPLNAFEGHKTLNYWPRLRALQLAAAKRAGEAIVLQVTNHVAGGAVSNVFLVREGCLATPIARGEEQPGALASPVLPGITRASVIEHAAAMGVACEARMLSVDDLLDADEVFLTNASWGVLPVVRIERKEIGPGAPGPVTKSIRSRWLGAIEEL